jgi:hypothetical protein
VTLIISGGRSLVKTKPPFGPEPKGGFMVVVAVTAAVVVPMAIPTSPTLNASNRGLICTWYNPASEILKKFHVQKHPQNNRR